jgi:hypothetical protein
MAIAILTREWDTGFNDIAPKPPTLGANLNYIFINKVQLLYLF